MWCSCSFARPMLLADEPIEVPEASRARRQPERVARSIGGAVAFSHIGDPTLGETRTRSFWLASVKCLRIWLSSRACEFARYSGLCPRAPRVIRRPQQKLTSEQATFTKLRDIPFMFEGFQWGSGTD